VRVNDAEELGERRPPELGGRQAGVVGIGGEIGEEILD